MFGSISGFSIVFGRISDLARIDCAGTSRMITLCREHGIPEPEFSAHPDWFGVTFAKDFYTDERLLAMGLSDRQVQAVRYVREQGTITNKEYREFSHLSPRAVLRELNDLCTREILVKQGTTGRSAIYLLKKKINPPNPPRTRHKPAKPATKYLGY